MKNSSLLAYQFTSNELHLFTQCLKEINRLNYEKQYSLKYSHDKELEPYRHKVKNLFM